MGVIISTKRLSEGVIHSIKLDDYESIKLRGQMDNICVFSLNTIINETKICQKGRKGCTKYIKIPKNLNKEINHQNNIYCERLDTKEKIIFVFVLDKI